MDTIEDVPVVDLAPAFDENYFVGPPPATSSSQSGQVQSDTPKGPVTRSGLANEVASDLSSSSVASTLTRISRPNPRSKSSYDEAVEYTPNHPSQMQTNLPHPTNSAHSSARFNSPRRGTRRSHMNPLSNEVDLAPAPPRFRPALLSDVPTTRTYLRQHIISRTTQPNILRPPSVPRVQNAGTNMPTNRMPSNINWVPPNQPKFGSTPNFQSMLNGPPGSLNWADPNLNLLQSNQPQPAHSNVPNITQAHSNIRAQVPPINNANPVSSGIQMANALVNNLSTNKALNGRPNFPSQAVPVRSAVEDFFRNVQAVIPGIDANQLVEKLTNNPNEPIQIPVPSGFNTMIMQQQLQQSLETIMNQALLGQNQYMQNNSQKTDLVSNTLSGQGTNNSQAPRPHIPPPPNEDDMAKQDLDVDAHHDEEYHEVETYSDYVPAKLTIGQPHPDPVVETSSLSTVEPPDVTYKLKLPSKVIDNALLSALQLESVIYACQQHNQFLADGQTRRGFLIGDGAGVGKGRTIAGIMYENFLCGRKKAIWFSVSLDLKLDAERDLKDVGAKIPVHLLGKFQYGRRINVDYGVLFTTYSGLVSKSQSVRGSLGSRLGQLVAWAGKDFDGVIVFDECHKAKNISVAKNKKKQSKAAEFALEIQEKLPNARIVYASATGASETKHLGYMTRLGIWGVGTPYETFAEFCDAIEKRGVGAMELVAVDLKMRGAYIARQLSFKTTSFLIQTAHLDQDFIKLYDECVDLWSKALRSFCEVAGYFAGDKKMSRTLWASFWAAHQKFFKYLCIGAKVPLVVEIAKRALAEDKCVVIGLQSTGEAKTLEALEDGDINEFISTAKATFESLIDNHFPAPGGARRRAKPSSSDASSVPSLPSAQSSPSNASSSTAIDESLHQDDMVKFVVEDGVVTAKLNDKASTKTSKKKENPERAAKRRMMGKNQEVLQELVERKLKSEKESGRALRAKARAEERLKRKSRIKRAGDDSDTEISNPFSSCSSEMATPTAHTDDDDDTYSESGDEESDDEDELSAESESASDSDIQITAVKPKRNYELIILSTDEEEDELDDIPSKDNPLIVHGDRLTEMQNELYDMVDRLGPKLPNNTLDDLIDRLGGPTKVAEMTGRKGRVVKDDDGQICYRHRNETDALDNLNVAEKERFMKGQKHIAIISEAASSGISLQADKRVANKKRRVHITIELPWSADRAIQQFGRTHRSNQLSGPEYVFVISELAGEKRFASIVAKRLESLGALTHGDRRATTESRDLSQFNIASRFCKQALELLCRLLERDVKFADIEPDYPRGDFIRDAREAFIGAGLGRNMYNCQVFIPDPHALQINHFLNRLLGMKVHIQNAIFKLFTDYMDRLIARKKISGQFDAGILELNSGSGKTHCNQPEDYYLKTVSGVVKCTLHNVQVERGISWDEALQLVRDNGTEDSRSGFYASVNPLTKAKMVFLVIRESHGVDMFRSYKPNTGRQAKPDYFSILTERGHKIDETEAKVTWQKVYSFTGTKCIHLCYFNSCKRIEAKMKCDVGLRHRYYCILSGSILTAWPYLEKKMPEATSKLQIVRLKLDEKNRVIGPIIPQDYLDRARKILKDGESGVQF